MNHQSHLIYILCRSLNPGPHIRLLYQVRDIPSSPTESLSLKIHTESPGRWEQGLSMQLSWLGTGGALFKVLQELTCLWLTLLGLPEHRRSLSSILDCQSQIPNPNTPGIIFYGYQFWLRSVVYIVKAGETETTIALHAPPRGLPVLVFRHLS